MAANIELETKFTSASSYLRMIAGRVEQSHLLELYGLYKQATCGPCNTSRPSWLQQTAKSKWESWKRQGEISKDEAMTKYILLVTTIDPDWEDEGLYSSSAWVSVSCPLADPEDVLKDSDKTLLDWAKEGAIMKVNELSVSQDVNQWDEEGMTALHWAADRGNTSMIECLIALGADVNLQDCEGQTALHYASSCGHAKVVEILLAHNANATLKDHEGDTPIDVATCNEIAALMN